jgi:hypothetical protein
MDIAKKVTFKGTAKDAKAGAVLIDKDQKVIYIEGLDAWPQEAFGKTIEATGVLVTKKYIPDPVNEAGEICQGAEGQQFVLEQAKWRLQDKAR